MESTKSFLSTISNDELSGIVRLVDSSTLVSLLPSKNCPLSRAIPLLVSKLNLSDFAGVKFIFEKRALHIGFDYSGRTGGVRFMADREASDRTISDIKMLVPALENCRGLKFKEISSTIGGKMIFDTISTQKVLNLIKDHALSFASYYRSRDVYTSSFAYENLNIVEGKFHIVRFSPAHPVSLTQVHGFRLKVIDCVKHTDMRSLDDLWEKVGDTLEEVRIRLYFPCRNSILQFFRKLKLHCRKLSKIYFFLCWMEEMSSAEPAHFADFADFICFYGAQLLETRLPSMIGDKSLIRIANACPNARIEMTAGDFSFSRLTSQLESLRIEYPFENLEDKWSSLALAMEKCTTLVTLDARWDDYSENVTGFDFLSSTSPSDFITSLLPMRMDSLHKLELECRGVSRADLGSLGHISSVTSNLKELTIRNGYISSESLEAICLANSNLEVLAITGIFYDARLNEGVPLKDEELESYFESLHPCKKLRDLLLDFGSPRPEGQLLRNICVPFRRYSLKLHFQFSNGRIQKTDGEMILTNCQNYWCFRDFPMCICENRAL